MDQKPPFSPEEATNDPNRAENRPPMRRSARRSPDELFRKAPEQTEKNRAAPPAPETAETEDAAPAESVETQTEEAVVGSSPEDLIEKTAPIDWGTAPDMFLKIEPKNPKTEQKAEPSLSPAANAFDWIKTFVFSLAAVILVFNFLFRGVTVDGSSMLPTLENGQYLIISDLFYTPKTGDIVVVQSPHYKNGSEPLIKRVIATSGQTVKINFNEWTVTVDGTVLEESYILREHGIMNCEDLSIDKSGTAEFVVDEGCVFVMGDNRNDSLDSRSSLVGQIDERFIMGRVLIRVYPISRFGKIA